MRLRVGEVTYSIERVPDGPASATPVNLVAGEFGTSDGTFWAGGVLLDLRWLAAGNTQDFYFKAGDFEELIVGGMAEVFRAKATGAHGFDDGQ